jgi:hypothetical protein
MRHSRTRAAAPCAMQQNRDNAPARTTARHRRCQQRTAVSSGDAVAGEVRAQERQGVELHVAWRALRGLPARLYVKNPASTVASQRIEDNVPEPLVR